ncbi:MAG: hypothetical protein Q7T57_08310 [Dehalococcoidales bacterium]|nr:hypothetical protein [Dehalococcoidales bacterium]
MFRVAGLLLLALLVLVAVVTFRSHSTPTQQDDDATTHQSTQFHSAGSTSSQRLGVKQRKAWPDSFNPNGRDHALPKPLRGDETERVHYMETIAADAQWFSACIVQEKIADEIELVDDVSSASSRRMSLDRSTAHAAARSSATARATKRKRDYIAAGGVPSAAFARDADGRHHYVPPQPSADDPSNPWLSPSNIFGFKRHPKRNPALACLYSPQYREANADLCATMAAPKDMGTMKSPFKTVSFALTPGKDTSCAAYGWFSNDMLVSGWNYLYLESNPTFDDEAQARAAGFLEGALTTQAIFEHRTNEFEVLFNNGIIETATKGFLNDMTTFNLQMVASNGATDPYWAQVGLLYQQLQGLYDGYTASQTDPNKAITYFELLCLQYDGDMSDIQSAVGPSDARVTVDDPLQRIMEYLIRNGHCSAMIKLTANNTELFSAHDTWAGFSSTHRMFKAHRFPYSHVSTTVIHFSSYPAFLASTDDWYQTYESQLTILETTNDIVNASLFNQIDSSTVASWARAMVASRLATGGADWVGYFANWQSGTYNNRQYTQNRRIDVCCIYFSADCEYVFSRSLRMDGRRLFDVYLRAADSKQYSLDHRDYAGCSLLRRCQLGVEAQRLLGQLQSSVLSYGLHADGLRRLERNLWTVSIRLLTIFPR